MDFDIALCLGLVCANTFFFIMYHAYHSCKHMTLYHEFRDVSICNIASFEDITRQANQLENIADSLKKRSKGSIIESDLDNIIDNITFSKERIKETTETLLNSHAKLLRSLRAEMK